MRKYNIQILKIILPGLLAACISLYSCSREKPVEQRISFPVESWSRFNILKFEFPLTESGKSYDIIFVLNCRKSFAYDELPLNMVLNTPSGEERIKEYVLPVKGSNGSFAGKCSGDTCVAELTLKRGLYCSNRGMMRVEIENLNPRLSTEGVFSASIVLKKR